MLFYMPFLFAQTALSPSTQQRSIDTPIYWYMWGYGNNESYAVSSLMEAKSKSGLNSVTLAFVIGNSTGGFNNFASNEMSDIKAFIASGGTVYISFGGATSPDVADILSEDQIFQNMEQLYLESGCRGFDWDIESAAVAMSIENTLRANVIKRMQSKYPEMYFSLTLPTDQHGLSTDGANCLALFFKLGVTINSVRGMVMDDYVNLIDWGVISIGTVDALKDQVKSIFGISDQQAYSKIMPIFMIGQNDDQTVFTLDNAQKLTNYVIEKQLAGISYWAFQRDQATKSGVAVSSNIDQSDFAYWNVVKMAQGGTLSTTTETLLPIATEDATETLDTLFEPVEAQLAPPIGQATQ